MDGVEDPDLEAILDDLQARYVLLPVQPGEFTCRMFELHTGLTHAQAVCALRRAQAEGTYVSVLDARGRPIMRNVAGHPARVYRQAQSVVE